MATLRDYYSLQKAWRCSWAIRCAIWSSGTSRTKTACRSPRKIRNSSTPFSNTALPHPWARMRFRNSRAFLKILFVWKIKCRKYTKFRRIQTRNKRIKSLKKKFRKKKLITFLRSHTLNVVEREDGSITVADTLVRNL